jgi:hypothetical protein
VESLEGLKEADFDDKISDEVDKVGKDFADQEKRTWGSMSPTWSIASKVVRKVKPIPWIFWVMIRSVYGSSRVKIQPDPMMFSVVENMLARSLDDKYLTKNQSSISAKGTTGRVNMLGYESVASLCFIHSICMRVSKNINDRIYRAIIDDALIRARLGCIIGLNSSYLDIGRPMLAGFAGRAGLAVQLASGTDDQARKALSGLATGKDISKMGIEVYGCDPLQVAALTLVAAGCSKNIAFGISAFSLPPSLSEPNPELDLWLNMFSAVEYLRMNKLEMITEECWTSLGLDSAASEAVINCGQNLFRTGHDFGWITTTLSQM